MKRLQFIGLALEMFGFDLAIMNSFYDNISKSIDRLGPKSLDMLGTNDFFFTMAAVTMRIRYPEDKNNIAFRRIFLAIILYSSFLF